MNVFKRIFAVFTAISMMMALSSCGDSSSANIPSPSEIIHKKVTYSAESGFYYSGDKGHTYGDSTKEYEVGETVYMKVKFKVNSDSKKASQVKVVLSIPNVENVDAKYMDGQIITPFTDAINNVTTYEFTANASKEAAEQECVIQFIPNAKGSVTMTLVYDDNVDPSYDIQSTLEFVDAESDEDTIEPEE